MILVTRHCPCGFDVLGARRSRPVIQADGNAIQYPGEVYRPRRLTGKANAAQLWERMYYRARKAGMTFRQAEALFAQENDWGYPPRNMPLMPRTPDDWLRRVADVARERLT